MNLPPRVRYDGIEALSALGFVRISIRYVYTIVFLSRQPNPLSLAPVEIREKPAIPALAWRLPPLPRKTSIPRPMIRVPIRPNP
jgi:hypothetical protein